MTTISGVSSVTDSSSMASWNSSNSTNYSNSNMNDSDSGLPCNYDPYVPTEQLVLSVSYPIIWAIGFPGNILAMLIWMQKRMRHSSGYYLAALALNDLLFLFLHVLYALETTFNVRVLAYPFLCQIYPMIYLSTQYISPALVLAFTTERYISICHPFKRETYCTTRRAKTVVACITAFYLLINVPNLYFFTLEEGNDCRPRFDVLRGDPMGIYHINEIIVQTLGFFVVPLVIVVLNTLVISEMRRLSKTEQAQQGGSTNRAGSTTIMLLVVSFYQIITTMPISIVYLFYVFQSIRQPESVCVVNFVQRMIFVYGITHYAFNIFIYLITGKLFRQQFKLLLLKPFTKLRSAISKDYSSLSLSRGTSYHKSSETKAAVNTYVSVNGRDGGGATVGVVNDGKGDTQL